MTVFDDLKAMEKVIDYNPYSKLQLTKKMIDYLNGDKGETYD